MIDFIFPRRLHRVAYLLRGLVVDAATGFLYCTITDAWIRWASVVTLSLYGVFFIVMPRIHDIGMSRWWLVATFVPVANAIFSIILIFRRPAILLDTPNKSLQPTATAPAI